MFTFTTGRAPRPSGGTQLRRIITVLSVAAALAASAVAVLLDRARASRRTASATG